MCKPRLYAAVVPLGTWSQSVQPLNQILNDRRKELGLTYEKVHAKMERFPWSTGVSCPSLAVVGHWFNGTRRPRNMEHLRGLLDALGMTLDIAERGAPAEAITATELAMLQAMRRMPDAMAESLLAIAQQTANLPKLPKN